MSDYARLCPVMSVAPERKPDKYTPLRATQEITNSCHSQGTVALVQRSIPLPRDGYGSISGSPAVRVLVVLGLTILVIVLSAILLPPRGTSAMPQDGNGRVSATTPR
jgi:hypothetical protein